MSGRWLINWLLFSNFIWIFWIFFWIFLNYCPEGGEIWLSPFVYNQTNITWTLPLPPFSCPPILGPGPSSPSRYMSGKQSSLLFFTPNSSGMPPGGAQHAQATCHLWENSKCIAIQGDDPFTDFNFFFNLSSLCPLPAGNGEFPLFCFYCNWLNYAPLHLFCLSTVYCWAILGECSTCLSTGGSTWVSTLSICLLGVYIGKCPVYLSTGWSTWVSGSIFLSTASLVV